MGLPRSTHYYRPAPARQLTLRTMARIDALYLDHPCSGSRRMVAYLAREETPISRDRVRNFMRRMGLRGSYQKIYTTVPGDPSERFPYLVDLKQVRAGNQVLGPISHINCCSQNSSTWWRSWICCPGTSSAGSSQTALTWNSFCKYSR